MVKFLSTRIKLLAVGLAVLGFGIHTDFVQAQDSTKWQIGFNRDKRDSIQESDTFVTIDALEAMPTFPGGDIKFLKFIKTNIQYPQKAIEEKIEGKVICGFIVNEDGSVSNVEILRGVHPLLDAEAIRIVKLFPKFNPGMQNGKPVKVKYTIPVPFILPKGK